MTETQLKRRVLKYLKATYPKAWIWKTSDLFYSGIPDVIMLNKGKLYAIELKVGDNKATKLQAYTLGIIRNAGGIVGVAYSIDDVKLIMKGEGGI